MTKWTFSPYSLEKWNSSTSRILMVAAEPNGDNPNSGNLDMGDWFRTAKPSNNFHSNKLFYNRCKMILNGILENEDDANFNHFRFMDLKATSGGSKSDENEIANYINEHLDEVLEFFVSTDEQFGIYPHVVIILGNNAISVFSKHIRQKLIEVNSKVQWVCMPHPSAQTVANEPMCSRRSTWTPIPE